MFFQRFYALDDALPIGFTQGLLDDRNQFIAHAGFDTDHVLVGCICRFAGLYDHIFKLVPAHPGSMHATDDADNS